MTMAMDEELVNMLKYMRLTGLLQNWDELVKLAEKKRLSNLRFLRHVLEEEYKRKQIRAKTLRLHNARIPEHLVMETFPFGQQPNLDKKRVLAIYDSFDYIHKTQNVIWLGPTGCGKTGLATAFLIQAIDRGCTGRYILFPELIHELYAAIADHSEKRVIKKYANYDCLLIDEIGYANVEAAQVGMFFTLMHKRHKNKPTLITSNLGFSDWRTFLKNDHLTAALIDRLTENSHVINMKNCVSLRAKLEQKT